LPLKTENDFFGPAAATDSFVGMPGVNIVPLKPLLEADDTDAGAEADVSIGPAALGLSG